MLFVWNTLLSAGAPLRWKHQIGGPDPSVKDSPRTKTERWDESKAYFAHIPPRDIDLEGDNVEHVLSGQRRWTSDGWPLVPPPLENPRHACKTVLSVSDGWKASREQHKDPELSNETISENHPLSVVITAREWKFVWRKSSFDLSQYLSSN